MKTIIVLSFLVCLVCGCATDIDRIKGISPPEDIYANYDCNQLEKACNDRATDIRVFGARQASKHDRDKGKMVLNILVLPVFWGVGNNDNTSKLQAAMGYYQEAFRKSDMLNCDFKREPLDKIMEELYED
jgi:hypothetical protein